MQERLMDIPLSRFEEPIESALKVYQAISDNGLVFDLKNASKLKLTPEMPNSARSATDASFMADKIGTLYIIAFKPGDGTGKESDSRKLSGLEVDPSFPYKTLIVPRDKDGVYHEVHLTIVKYAIGNAHAEPEMFAGNFDLVGLDGKRIVKIGELGQKSNKQSPLPAATFTVGYDKNKIRYCDPHAVYSGITDAIQVCAFLAISNEIHERYQHILDCLNPQLPTKT